uniref:(northern house mosquito) hypothetical protein n=1 Tax=Culex pipiens TaxID=7175 RepID=A0A8D8NCF5_CULPI
MTVDRGLRLMENQRCWARSEDRRLGMVWIRDHANHRLDDDRSGSTVDLGCLGLLSYWRTRNRRNNVAMPAIVGRVPLLGAFRFFTGRGIPNARMPIRFAGHRNLVALPVDLVKHVAPAGITGSQNIGVGGTAVKQNDSRVRYKLGVHDWTWWRHLLVVQMVEDAGGHYSTSKNLF